MVRGFRRVAIGASVAGLVGAGCAQLFGIDPPNAVDASGDGAIEAPGVGDGAVGADGAPLPDATTDGSDATADGPDATADAGADTSADAHADTSSSAEAGDAAVADAHADADASAVDASDGSVTGRFCDTVVGALYCEDFDLSTSLANFQLQLSDGGAAVIDTTDPKSAPHSLHLTDDGTSLSQFSQVIRNLGVTPTQYVTIDLDVKFNPPPPGIVGGPVSFDFAGSDFVQVLSDNSEITIQDIWTLPDGGRPGAIGTITPYSWLPLAWHHVTLGIAKADAGYAATVTIDGALVNSDPLYSGFVFAPLSFWLNCSTYSYVEPSALNVDNIVVRYQ